MLLDGNIRSRSSAPKDKLGHSGSVYNTKVTTVKSVKQANPVRLSHSSQKLQSLMKRLTNRVTYCHFEYQSHRFVYVNA